MGLRNWIRNTWNRGRTNYRPTVDLFPELDLSAMARRLHLAELGTNRGRRNEPAPDATSPDEVENRIMTEIEAEKRRAHAEANDHLRAVRERVAALQLDSLIAKVAVATDAAVADIRRAVITGKDRLYALRTAAVSNGDAVRQFREKHALQRPPRYPTSRVFHIGVIAILVVIESAANTFLIALGHQLGILGGFVNAITISALNVGGGVAAGLIVMRYLNHRSRIHKSLATLGVVIFAVLVLTFNLLVAHYRDVFESGNGAHAAETALQDFRRAPFMLNNLNGWILFAVGCSFAMVAAYDGFRLDDPYPGYGALARRAEEANSDYVDAKERALADITATRDLAIRVADNTLAEIDLRRTQHDSIIAQQRKLIDSYDQHVRYLEQCANELLSTYRDANRSGRSQPTPVYWTQRLTLDRPTLPFAIVAEDPGTIAKVREQLVEILSTHRQRLRSEYEAALNAFELLEDLNKGAATGASAL